MSMSIDGIGGGVPFDKDTFGAAVVSETLDTLNGTGGATAAPVDKASAEASLVSKTLDTLNASGTSGDSGMAQSYEFQTDVLGAASGVVDTKI